MALVKLNDELIFYKEAHKKLLETIKKKKQSITRYENLVTKLEEENTKLRNQYKLKLLKINNEKESMISRITQLDILQSEFNNLNKNPKNNINNNKTTTTNNSINNRNENNHNINININIDKTKNNTTNNINNEGVTENLITSELQKMEKEKNTTLSRETTMDEFSNILKNVGLTREIFEKLSKIKGCCKLTDSVEFFYKLVLEKNKQILILEKENESLVFKNFELNKANMELEQLLNETKNTSIFNTQKLLHDNSMINNISRNEKDSSFLSKLNLKNNNTSNSLLNYQKLLKKQKEEGQIKTAELFLDIASSEKNSDTSNGKKDEIQKDIIDQNYTQKSLNNAYLNSQSADYLSKEDSNFPSDMKSEGIFNDTGEDGSMSNEKNFEIQDTLNSLDFQKGIIEELKKQNSESNSNMDNEGGYDYTQSSS